MLHIIQVACPAMDGRETIERKIECLEGNAVGTGERAMPQNMEPFSSVGVSHE